MNKRIRIWITAMGIVILTAIVVVVAMFIDWKKTDQRREIEALRESLKTLEAAANRNLPTYPIETEDSKVESEAQSSETAMAITHDYTKTDDTEDTDDERPKKRIHL